MTKHQPTLKNIATQSVQAESREATANMRGAPTRILPFIQMARAGNGGFVNPWWSPKRDIDLLNFVHQVDQLKGAIAKTVLRLSAIKPHIEPRDENNPDQIALASFYSTQLELFEWGQGFQTWISKWLWSRFTQDNGAFAEILGGGDPLGPIVGPARGVVSLDSQQCLRTGDLEYPVTFTDLQGRQHSLHRSRVIFSAEMPQPQADMFGVGLCWVSRALDVAQHLLDIAVYKQEKLGSRPIRQLLIGQGLTAEEIWTAIADANITMDTQGLARFAKSVVVGSEYDQSVDILIKDLASLPDGFDERTSVELGMFTIALAGGIPPRDLWPATTAGATRADATFQHLGGGATYEAILDNVAFLLGGSQDGAYQIMGRFLPPSLKLTFDVVDDQQDKMQAEIRERRARARAADLKQRVISIRVARQQALKAGDLTYAQFEQLELQDGRLADGTSVLTLFVDPDYQSLFNLTISPGLLHGWQPQEFETSRELFAIRILELQAAVRQSKNTQQRRKFLQAVYAIKELQRKYLSPQEKQNADLDLRLWAQSNTRRSDPPTDPQRIAARGDGSSFRPAQNGNHLDNPAAVQIGDTPH